MTTRLALIGPSIVAKVQVAGKPNRLTNMKQSNRSNELPPTPTLPRKGGGRFLRPSPASGEGHFLDLPPQGGRAISESLPSHGGREILTCCRCGWRDRAGWRRSPELAWGKN